MNNSDERDYEEEAANRREMQEQDHCIQGDSGAPCTDVDAGGDCVCCDCCCTSLAMEYGPQNGLGMTDKQRAPARAFLEGGAS